MSRYQDGLDQPFSANGPHPLYYVREEDGTRKGPFGCLREAQLACDSKDAEITDHHDRVLPTA